MIRLRHAPALRHAFRRSALWILLLGSGVPADATPQDRVGAIRGVVTDADFPGPLPLVRVQIVETQQVTETSTQGLYELPAVEPGSYTVVFTKPGFSEEAVDVVVEAGGVAEASLALRGKFTDMPEFVAQDDLQLGTGTEEALLQLRFDSAALLDSISSDLMSRAGASDAASALPLIAGATVQDGKFAVIRGLPDRYVSSLLNDVRVPSADEDTRAVELDQFPSAVIESIQVSKTFTPDMQGDASGGSVNVVLKGLPDEAVFSVKAETGYNTQAAGRDDFLSYDGGGVGGWGRNEGSREIQRDALGGNWDGAVGVSEVDSPVDFKWSMSGGDSVEVADGVRVGGFASLFYERDSSFYDNGVDDSLWVDTPGEGLTPKYQQGQPLDGDFKTSLFDVTRASQLVQWGSLGTLGVETENHFVGLTYLYTRTAEDVATLAEDTRGKEYYFPGYDRDDPFGEGNEKDNRSAAPYIRTETLEYTERVTRTLQLTGRHTLPLGEAQLGRWKLLEPELDWTLADSAADLDQPDKRQFGSLWLAEGWTEQGTPTRLDAEYFPYKPGANFSLGNLQRIWKDISEDSAQVAANLRMPFEQWGGEEGYLKVGVFRDDVERKFDQNTYSNFGDSGASRKGDWEDYWSKYFPDEDHPISAGTTDVDYDGEQTVSAYYSMVDLPVSSKVNVIGGARVESTEISIVNDPEKDALWFPPGSNAPVKLTPGAADVSLDQEDTLPSLGVVYKVHEDVTLRAAYSRTIARQTFKELTPIIQQEFLGGPIFVGNPDLGIADVTNYDFRADYAPFQGSLVSFSYFLKDIEDPIEYVQRIATGFDYTTPVNYPDGELSRFEFEVRQDLGRFWQQADGLSVGANATFIDSEVKLPQDEIDGFDLPGIQAPLDSRDATGAPEHLYNLFLTYDWDSTNTQVGLFYTIQGDTLVAGAGQANGNFVPSVYATEFDTLNLSLTQGFGKYVSVTAKAKNLTNPEIQTVYRSEYIGDDVLKTSFTRGIEYSLSLGFQISF